MRSKAGLNGRAEVIGIVEFEGELVLGSSLWLDCTGLVDEYWEPPSLFSHLGQQSSLLVFAGPV